MRQNPEDAVQMLIDDKLLPDSISKEEHINLWKTLQFGPSDAMAEEALKTIIKCIQLIKEDKAEVKVLKSADRWYGVTYKEDKESVVAALQSMKDKGEYPPKLWK